MTDYTQYSSSRNSFKTIFLTVFATRYVLLSLTVMVCDAERVYSTNLHGQLDSVDTYTALQDDV